jgi:phosphoglycerate dehydrogenase-like enzyme
MTKIAILDDYQQVALKFADWQQLPSSCAITVFSDHLPYGDALVARLEPFDVLCIMRERTPFPRALLSRLPLLKLLITSGARNAAIDLAAARELDITVCGTQSPAYATPELAMGLILSLARGLPREIDSFRQGGWQVGVGRDLHGSTLGILGLGRLGSRVAELGRAFGMHVIAWSQNLTVQRAQEVGVHHAGKEELFSQSDFLTIHLKLGDRSRGLVDAQALAMMKASAFLINTSRGPIVDETALITALNTGQIAGVAIDVYDEEPLPPEHPLRHMRNAVCTPHIGYVTEQTYRAFYTGMVDVIKSYLAGGTPLNVLE